MTTAYFTYEKKKVIQALRYHFISRKEIKMMIIIVNVFAIISAALFFAKKISPLAFLVSSVLWIAMMISFWFLLPISIYKRSATFKDRFKATVDEEGLMIETDNGSRQWQWNELSTMMESPHFFHLYFDSRSFFIIPKAAFNGDDEHVARRIMMANINAKAKK